MNPIAVDSLFRVRRYAIATLDSSPGLMLTITLTAPGTSEHAGQSIDMPRLWLPAAEVEQLIAALQDGLSRAPKPPAPGAVH